MPIELEHVTHIYSAGSPFAKTALDDISLSFDKDTFTALIGKTGSGKSTLIQHLNALLLPTNGIVKINDHVIDMTLIYKKNGKVNVRAMKKKHKKKIKDIKTVRKNVGIVFQFPEYQLFAETVIKDVSYGPKNFGESEEEAIKSAKEALALVGLNKTFYDRSPFELSGGEKRRVAIAGILAFKPNVLVLDEPTVGLDAKSEENLMSLLVKLHNSGTQIILATHNMDVVLRYAKRVIVLEKGKIAIDTDPLSLFQNKEFLSTSSLEPPKVFSFAMSLKSRGVNIDLTKVKDTDSLALEIIRARKEKNND